MTGSARRPGLAVALSAIVTVLLCGVAAGSSGSTASSESAARHTPAAQPVVIEEFTVASGSYETKAEVLVGTRVIVSGFIDRRTQGATDDSTDAQDKDAFYDFEDDFPQQSPPHSIPPSMG